MHFRSSSGLALAYRCGGAGRPVVFLHTAGTSAAMWEPVVEALGDGYRSIAMDLRGHGDSEVPRRGFSLDELAEDAIELIELQQAQGAVLVGCSFGGMVAQGLALKAPGLLAGIVLAGTSHQQSEQSRAAMAERAREARDGMSAAVVERTLERWFPADYRAANPAMIERVRGWLAAADPMVAAWTWEAIRDLDYGQRLGTVALPALILRGSEDAATPLDRMQAIAALLPRGRFVALPAAGHLAPLQQPTAFASVLREFIEGLG